MGKKRRQLLQTRSGTNSQGSIFSTCRLCTACGGACHVTHMKLHRCNWAIIPSTHIDTITHLFFYIKFYILKLYFLLTFWIRAAWLHVWLSGPLVCMIGRHQVESREQNTGIVARSRSYVYVSEWKYSRSKVCFKFWRPKFRLNFGGKKTTDIFCDLLLIFYFAKQ